MVVGVSDIAEAPGAEARAARQAEKEAREAEARESVRNGSTAHEEDESKPLLNAAKRILGQSPSRRPAPPKDEDPSRSPTDTTKD